MAIGSKNLDAVSLRERSDEELVEELRQAKESLFNLRFQGATGQLESHGRLKAVRRDIARLYTIMRERELGIDAVVAAPSDKKAAAEKVETDKSASSAQKSADEKAAPKKRAAKKTAAAADASPSAEKSASTATSTGGGAE